MIYVTIALTVALWIFSIVLAFLAGRFSMRNELGELEPASEERTLYSSNVALSEDQIDLIRKKVLSKIIIPPPIKGDPGPPGKTPDANDIVMDNGDSLTYWAEAVLDRIKRVERKVGMRV